MNKEEYYTSLENEINQSAFNTLQQIKMACIGFARDINKIGGAFYNPDDVLNYSKELFDWVMDKEGFEKQQ